MKISEIAKIFDGKLVNVNEDVEITGLKSLSTAKEGEATFVSDPKYYPQAEQSKASLVIIDKELEAPIPQMVVKKPNIVFYKLIDLIYPEEKVEGKISPTAVIDETAEIGENTFIDDHVVIKKNVKIGNNVKIYPFVYIGENTEIGDNTTIYSNVTIFKDTKIGKRVIIQSGARIASDGYGYYQEDGKHKKIKHIGKVIIEDDVEIGANACIDRALLDETKIGKGTKVDNLVMVAHNCRIGENTLLIGQTGLAGSVTIGNNCILAGQVGIKDHITIEDNVIVAAKSGVINNLKSGKMYGSSMPAVEWTKWKRILVYLYKLPEIAKKLK